MTAGGQDADFKRLLANRAQPLRVGIGGLIAQVVKVAPPGFECGNASTELLFAILHTCQSHIQSFLVQILLVGSHGIGDLLQLPVVFKSRIHGILKHLDFPI